MTTPWRRRKERALATMEALRHARRLLDEDVTVLGEQLAELHVDTLTDELDAAAAEDYRHALGRSRLADGEAPDVRLVRVGDRYVPWWQAKDNRGALVHSVGTAAFDAVPPHIRYEADLARMRNQGPSEARRS